MADGIASALGGSVADGAEESKGFTFDSILPRISRGFVEEGKDDGVVVGWKAEVRSRKDREEVLR